MIYHLVILVYDVILWPETSWSDTVQIHVVQTVYKHEANHAMCVKAWLVMCCLYTDTNDCQDGIRWLEKIGVGVSAASIRIRVPEWTSINVENQNLWPEYMISHTKVVRSDEFRTYWSMIQKRIEVRILTSHGSVLDLDTTTVGYYLHGKYDMK